MSERRRGQAAIFDGLFFLLISMASVAMIFYFLSPYGQSQDQTMRSAHTLNFVQSAFKAMYYVDASTLSAEKLPDEAAGSSNCLNLGTWSRVTVMELLKKDLRDGKFDDKYGPADAPGKLAARCAFARGLKTFTDAGYSYYVQIQRIDGAFTIDVVPPDTAADKKNISSSIRINNCSNPLMANNFVVAAPFKVFRCTSASSSQTCAGTGDQYLLRVCTWQTQMTP